MKTKLIHQRFWKNRQYKGATYKHIFLHYLTKSYKVTFSGYSEQDFSVASFFSTKLFQLLPKSYFVQLVAFQKSLCSHVSAVTSNSTDAVKLTKQHKSPIKLSWFFKASGVMQSRQRELLIFLSAFMCVHGNVCSRWWTSTADLERARRGKNNGYLSTLVNYQHIYLRLSPRGCLTAQHTKYIKLTYICSS